MRVNLVPQGGAPLGGYVNITERFENLSDRVLPNEAREIIALDILGKYPREQAQNILGGWVSRLRKGATLTVSVVDIREIARGVLDGTLGTLDADSLLYPGGCIVTVSELANGLEQAGLKVLRKFIDNRRAVVVAKRPE